MPSSTATSSGHSDSHTITTCRPLFCLTPATTSCSQIKSQQMIASQQVLFRVQEARKKKKKRYEFISAYKKRQLPFIKLSEWSLWLKNKNSTCRLTDTKIQDLSVSLDVPFLCLSTSFFSAFLLHTILHITLPPSN